MTEKKEHLEHDIAYQSLQQKMNKAAYTNATVDEVAQSDTDTSGPNNNKKTKTKTNNIHEHGHKHEH